MSSIAFKSKLRAACAVALSGLILSSGTVALAQAEGDVDNWIKESGTPKVHPSASLNHNLESAHAGTHSLQPMVAIPDTATPEPAAPTQGKKLAQVLPANVTAAINHAAPGTAPIPLLKGGVTFCIPKGTPLKLRLATIPMPELKQEIRDEEGNLRPAQMGEIITARITEDIYVDDNKVIPEGTVFHGRVSKISPPRHVGRPGHLEISFDSFKTPDGRKFAFRAQANNFKQSTNKSKLKGAGRLASHAAGGAALGALVAYKMFGPEQTIAMHGYNIAGGAAIGAVGGLAYALWKRGPHAVLEPGDEFNMSIDTDMLIPAATAPTPKAPPISLPGFEMEVLSKKTVKDGFGGHMIRIESLFTNHTHKKLASIDLFLEDENHNRYPVSPDIDEQAEELFYINPLSIKQLVCTFAVQFPKLKHKLVWLDHHSHNVIFEQKL